MSEYGNVCAVRSGWKSKVVCGLVLVGWIGSVIAGLRGNPGTVAEVSSSSVLPGPAILGGVIGGLRVPLGDMIWLRGNREWVEEDAAGVLENLELVYWLRPEAIPFRIEGARTIAYDFPQWESARSIQDRSGWVDLALDHLDRAMAELGTNGYLLATCGEIVFRGKADPAAAARWYRAAAMTPEAADFFEDAAAYLERLAALPGDEIGNGPMRP